MALQQIFRRYIFALLLISAHIANSSKIHHTTVNECYNCDSAQDARCADETKLASFKQTCGSRMERTNLDKPEYLCRKLVYYPNKTTEFVIRECVLYEANKTYPCGKDISKFIDAKVQSCNVCGISLCNSSTATLAKMIASIGIPFIVITISRLRLF